MFVECSLIPRAEQAVLHGRRIVDLGLGMLGRCRASLGRSVKLGFHDQNQSCPTELGSKSPEKKPGT